MVAPNNQLEEDLRNNEYVEVESNHDGQALENVEMSSWATDGTIWRLLIRMTSPELS